MPLTLHIDRGAWRGHIARVRADRPGVIPVAKGNGYGQGVRRLAEVAQEEGFDTLAVATLPEATEAGEAFLGDILILTPADPRAHDAEPDPALAGRLVLTVSSVEALRGAAAQGRWVLELATPLGRFGLEARDLPAAADLPRPPAALALHLPLDLRPGRNLAAASSALDAAAAAGLPTGAVQVSHLSAADTAVLAERFGATVRPRVGTDLWIGDGRALGATGTVRAVHEVGAGRRAGYRQARVRRRGHLVVVDGGTCHGVGLAAPRVGDSLSARLRGLAADFLTRGGIVLSPFSLDGRRLVFADSPHAQVSMLLVPARRRPPEVGEEFPVRVRHTILRPDAVVEA